MLVRWGVGSIVQALKVLYGRSGFLLWLLTIVSAVCLAALKPQSHSVLPAYEFGTAMFQAGRPLYDLNSAMGYLYTPAFAALYTPFAWLGSEVGGILWRLLGVSLLTFAIIKQARVFDKVKAEEIASLAFFLAIPLSLGAIRNGQATVLLTAACWLLTLSALGNRRAETVLWALIALIAKPTAVVMVLLVGAMRPRLIPFLALAVGLVFAIPYAFAPVDYVNAQHAEFFRLLTSMGANRSGTFEAADFTGLFAALDIALPASVTTVLRLAAAGAVLVAALWLDRKNDRQLSAFTAFLLAAYYMTVFNPRVESNTYVMLVAPAALAISLMRARDEAWNLILILGAVVFMCGWTGIDRGLHAALNPWFKPLVMTLVLIPVFHWLYRQVTARAYLQPPAALSLAKTG
ncbi:hypothetical protein CYK37_22725 [Mesorhizobium loti]|nr:glycosyltransferase family 87 protein [Mesorhizobium loti]PLP57055.1 hypothetical protein CYK37_22725 [Mesorhizobium loti]